MELRLGRGFLLSILTVMLSAGRFLAQFPSTVTPSYSPILIDDPFKGPTLGKCIFSKHTNELDEKKILARLTPLVGKRFPASDDLADGWDFEVGICETADADYENKVRQNDFPYKRAGAIQLSKTRKNDQDYSPNIIGGIQNAEVMAGTDWVMLEYENGDFYGHHCGGEGKRTIIMITCVPGEKTGVFRLVEENNNKSADCYYLFELEHEAACFQSPSGLSVGSIVCIVFFSLVGLYLVAGFIYQRFVVGAKGIEQIPNVHFWRDFGNLQADGCDLLCRCGPRTYASRQYRGVGDDQLNSQPVHDDEEVADDHLLPM